MSVTHQPDMQSASKPKGSEPSTQPLQPLGISKDRTGSVSGSFSLASPPHVDPDPAYIAAAAASHIVTGDHQNQTEDWFEDKGNQFERETALVSSTSLALVNAFLDQLLFNFLASARSTSIASLRPAVSEVLKPRLAKDAISGADEELHEFLGGGDEEELSAFHSGLEHRGTWDLNLVWRRTRLRCMVYTRLGDMEEEDEETFIEREQLEEAGQGYRRLSRDLGIVSPAAAIFLTSILEFIGEQSLMVAGEAAYARIEARRLKSPESDIPRTAKERVVVEDIDMEKIAFNTTLGRLWRSWKKRVRYPSMLSVRTISREFARGKGVYSLTSNSTSRSAGDGEFRIVDSEPGDTARPSVLEVAGGHLQSELSPSRSSNVDRREALPADSLPEEGHQGLRALANPGERRRSSMILYPQRSVNPPGELSQNAMQRRRSSSLPTLRPVSIVSPSSETLTAPAEAPNSCKNSSTSAHEKGEPRPAAPSQGGNGSTTVATLYDDTIDANSNTYPNDSDQFKGGSQGMSKEEFDRQMLQLVEEMRPQGTSGLLKDERRVRSNGSSDDVSDNGSAEAGAKADFSPVDTRKIRSEMQASRGIGQSTLAYWHGAPDASHSAPSQKPLKEDEGAFDHSQSKLTGGQRPRPTSEGDNEYGRTWERQMPYFYHGASTSHSNQDDAVSQQLTKEVQYDSPLATPIRDDEGTPEIDIGAPPLTPLRELMEAARDTSDEASSIALSRDASRSNYASSDRFENSDIPRSSSLSSQALSQARPRSKVSDLRSQLPAVNTGTDHAAVQRVLPSPISAREPLTPVGRTSTSSNRGLRPIQTSSSGTSQISQKLRGIVGRDSNESRRPGTSRDSSEGSDSFVSDKLSQKTPRAADAQKSFDRLIKSDETIQYTLTPQNMREMEVITFLTALGSKSLDHALICVSHLMRQDGTIRRQPRLLNRQTSFTRQVRRGQSRRVHRLVARSHL